MELKREKVHFRVLSAKPNFYVLVDEAHRSQYDFLAAFMRASLPNAKFIAFTGTPLLNEDKHTLAEFGGETYIDEYRLHEAVADGATLPIKYQDAWVKLAADAKLDEAFNAEFAQAPEAHQLALKKALLARWRNAGDRIDQVAAHLVEHFVSHVQAKGLKAMLVCNGRDMAVRYKDLLDDLMAQRAAQGLPTFQSQVVISLAGITGTRRPIASSAGTTLSRRALNSARRRSYSAMDSGSKQASAARCAMVEAQMKRFCASFSIAPTSAGGTTIQPRRQPVIEKYFEKLLMEMTSSPCASALLP